MAVESGSDGGGVRDSDSSVRAGGELPAEPGAVALVKSLCPSFCEPCAVAYYGPLAAAFTFGRAFASTESCPVCQSLARARAKSVAVTTA
jgi:hypothetical protein